jgi:hypothetical protein
MRERTKHTKEERQRRSTRFIAEGRSAGLHLSSDLLALLLLLLRGLLVGGLAAPALLVLLLVVVAGLALLLFLVLLLFLILLGGAGGDDVGHLGVDLDLAQDGIHGSLLRNLLANLDFFLEKNKWKTYHSLLVPGWCLSGGVELESLLDLSLKSLTELRRRGLGEVINPRSNGALVGQESGDAALVLGASASDEAGVVDETVLGGVSLSLQRAEEGLLGTENLDGGGGVLGEVGEGARVGDEARGDDLADQRGQVGRDDGHLVGEVLEEGAAVFGELDDAVGERGDVLHVLLGDVLAHRDLAGVDNGLGDVSIVVDERGDVVEPVVAEGLLVADGEGKLGEGVVVRDDLDQLGEVPRVPLANTHGECVDGLVEVVQGGNGLDDVVVVLLDGELDLCARVGVAKTKLCSLDISLVETLEQLSGVRAQASEHVGDNLGGIASLALDGGEVGLDATGQGLVLDTENGLLLLADFWETQLEDGAEVFGQDTLRDEVDVLKGLGRTSVISVSNLVLEELIRFNCTCKAQS